MIALAIRSLLWFCIKFRIVFSTIKKCHWNLDRDCIESIDDFGTDILEILILPVCEHMVYFNLFISSISFINLL